MQAYEALELEVVEFEATDVITGSCVGVDDVTTPEICISDNN